MSCPDSNTSGIVVGISSVVVLFVSELLPFIPQLSGNGIVHALILSLRNQLPTTRPTTRTAIPTTEESPVTSTV